MTDRSSATGLRLLPASSPTDAASSLFDHPAFFYDPPYASPAHDAFAWHLVKYLKPGTQLRYLVGGPEEASIRPDFVVERASYRVGFVVGGAADDFVGHADGPVGACGTMDVCYYVRAEDVERRIHDVLWLVARWETALFSERGRINLHTLATPAVRAVVPGAQDGDATVQYNAETQEVPDTLRLRRQRRVRRGGEATNTTPRSDGPPASVSMRRWARSA